MRFEDQAEIIRHIIVGSRRWFMNGIVRAELIVKS